MIIKTKEKSQIKFQLQRTKPNLIIKEHYQLNLISKINKINLEELLKQALKLQRRKSKINNNKLILK